MEGFHNEDRGEKLKWNFRIRTWKLRHLGSSIEGHLLLFSSQTGEQMCIPIEDIM